jgi:hypothetical protein
MNKEGNDEQGLRKMLLSAFFYTQNEVGWDFLWEAKAFGLSRCVFPNWFIFPKPIWDQFFTKKLTFGGVKPISYEPQKRPASPYFMYTAFYSKFPE